MKDDIVKSPNNELTYGDLKPLPYITALNNSEISKYLMYVLIIPFMFKNRFLNFLKVCLTIVHEIVNHYKLRCIYFVTRHTSLSIFLRTDGIFSSFVLNNINHAEASVVRKLAISSLNATTVIIQKPVNLFALQINGLVSI